MVENAGNVDSLKSKTKLIYSLTLSYLTVWHISFQAFSKCVFIHAFLFLFSFLVIVMFTVYSFYIVWFATNDAIIYRSRTYQSPQSFFSSQNQANGKHIHSSG